MGLQYIKTGDKVSIVVPVLDKGGDFLAGKTDIKLKIRRTSDSMYYDWSDGTFKVGASVVTLAQALSEVSATYSPGIYQLPGGFFDTSVITNAAVSDTYVFTAEQDPGTDADNLPLMGEVIAADPGTTGGGSEEYPVLW